jgi:hypothetical protein
MGNLSIPQRKERLDDTFKVLLVIFTLLLSTVTSIYRETSTVWTIFLFVFYIFTICSWSVAHLSGGEIEYFVKFMSWYSLLGGISQAIFMLYLGTLALHGYPYIANWVISVILLALVFRYIRLLLEEDIRKYLRKTILVIISLGVVLCCLNFVGVI